jgi:hypothetical protein
LLFLFITQVILQGHFQPGDGPGYHYRAITAIAMFSEGTFLITPQMLAINYSGYPAYFIAPIYILGGPSPHLVHLVQLMLHVHVAFMLYRLTDIAMKSSSAPKYVFFFALFFPDSMGLAFYHLKDVLILWCIAVAMLNTTKIIYQGYSQKRLLWVLFACVYLATLRIPYALLTILSIGAAVMEGKFISRKLAWFGKITAVAFLFYLFRDHFEASYDTAAGFMEVDSYRYSAFGEAYSPKELVSVIIRSPLRGFKYILKVFSAFMTGGLAAIREIYDIDLELARLNTSHPFVVLGAAWRFANLPFTLFGLFLILRRFRREFDCVLSISAFLMISMFVIGYSGRWGLPGMMINCIAWGVGYSRISIFQTKIPRRSGVSL